MSHQNQFCTALMRYVNSGSRANIIALLKPAGANLIAMRAPKSLALMFILVAGAAAQVDSNAILGFETAAGWVVKSSSASTTVSSTTTRTQENFAYAIGDPANLVTLTSMPVASTATALAGVGDLGAIFEVDVFLPAKQGTQVNGSSLKLFLSSPSTGLNHVQIGEVDFTDSRRGIYSTMKFPIPDAPRSALGGATFKDLTFEFMLSSPGIGAGTYIFDNLRVHSVSLVTAHAGTVPPPGYGGSVDLVVIGSLPTSQLFNVGPVQVPNGFHLKLGAAGTTTVQLQLGHDGAADFTCTYGPDSTDAIGKSYILTSCTSGIQAGDLVGANWAQLAIVGGDPSMKIRAQLAQKPVGDLVGAGIIPPMPTHWGDFDGCVPPPKAGTVVTVSTSCANQTAEAHQIVTNYFNQVTNSGAAPNWIVTPKPEFARRHGDGTPHDNTTGSYPPPNDPPFDQESHLNQGGDWDAYWRLNGDLTTTNYPNTDRNTTRFDATFSTHAVLFGQDVDILAINTAVNTDTGETTPFIAPSSSGTLNLMLFGIEIPPGGYSANPGTAINVNPSISQDYNLPPIQIWIFSITIGATASVGVDANLAIAPSGIDGQIIPHGVALMGASAGAHLAALAALAGDAAPFAAAYPGDPYAINARVKAVVAAYGVYDLVQHWNHELVSRPRDQTLEKFLGTTPMDNRKVYFEASPINYVIRANNQISFFLTWGTGDDMLSTSQSEDFLLALKQAEFFVRTAAVPGAPNYWLGDPIDEPGGYAGLVAPQIVWFLQHRL